MTIALYLNNMKYTDKDRERDEILFNLLGGKRDRVRVPGIGTKDEERGFYLKVGDKAWLDTAESILEKPNWKLITITYIRSGVIFYKIDGESEEKNFGLNCLGINLGMLMPVEYISPWPSKYYEVVCRCPHTKIIYND